ncbi:3-oxoacyl-[acyl-carrier-protein] synthase 2 [Sphaerotilus microaerophilus]|uniref:Nodulation protein E n=2 Tax=Sphaerotilus microaerophilus TaxID=2914710 RepID=A0ABN6PS45_9BURK|nr:3-oxoacyl-[acyl-carrier-protein] synthase 2 [Sphaerotilus sp. FB-5]
MPMQDLPKVVVTGLGLMSPHGDDPQAVFEAVMAGRSAVRPVFPELPKAAAAAVVDFDESRWFTKLQLAGLDRVSRLAVAAADLALKDAAVLDGLDPDQIGVYAGCGMGGGGSLELAYRGNGRVPPLTIPAFMPNAPAAHIAMRWKLTGPVLTYSVACASSAVALMEAAKAVQRGEVEVALTGGSEALVFPGITMAWQAMQTLANVSAQDPASACRPFASDRSGFVIGEGAAFLVLETEARARARGATIYAELSGWGTSCDASHLSKPDAAGQAKALRAALRQARVTPAEVGYCNAHGTATRVGDVVEAQALAQVWGDALAGLRVSSTKALHGHLIGAAGALEAILTVLALQQRRLPPNMHCMLPDPECPLALVLAPEQAAPDLEVALSSSFAFGGSNVALVFRRV